MIEEIKNFNAVEHIASLKEIVDTFLESYKINNSWKIRLIDSFIVFCTILLVLQLIYVVLVGVFPMNSFLSGIACSLGSITLAGK